VGYSRSPVTAKEVREALMSYLADCAGKSEEPASETAAFCTVLTSRLNPDYSGLRPWDALDAKTKFRAQVLAQLNKLTAEGVLVKRGERRGVHFFTPEAAQHHDEDRERRRAGCTEKTARTAAVRVRLAHLRFSDTGTSQNTISLELDDWEALVSLAENGKALHR
jgi:hypothetical protein